MSTHGSTRKVAADTLLLPTGRVPNTDLMEVATTGVETDEWGFIVNDEYMETRVPGVWALRDIVARYSLKQSANLEAAHVAYNVLNSDGKVPVDYHSIFAFP